MATYKRNGKKYFSDYIVPYEWKEVSEKKMVEIKINRS